VRRVGIPCPFSPHKKFSVTLMAKDSKVLPFPPLGRWREKTNKQTNIDVTNSNFIRFSNFKVSYSFSKNPTVLLKFLFKIVVF